MLLLLASVLGFVLRDDPDLRDRILDSTISQFPVIGDQLRDPSGLQGSGVAVVVGALVAVYGALGVANALQNAMNIAWAVPRNKRPNPIKARVRSLLIVLTAGVAVVATTTVSIIAGTVGAEGGVLSSPAAIAATIAAVVVNTVIFDVVFRVATAARLGLLDVLPGAVLAAILWQLMQVFGTAYADNVVRGSTLTYGTFAFVLGLLAWTFLVALGVVLCVELNVVRAKRLYPRALLTPFTDHVDLTPADRRAYEDAAKAQRHKGFEDVAVSFAHDGQYASTRREAADQPAVTVDRRGAARRRPRRTARRTPADVR